MWNVFYVVMEGKTQGTEEFVFGGLGLEFFGLEF